MPPALPDWIADYYGAVDANDGAGALAQLASDVEVQFGGRPVAFGRDDARATLAAVHANFERVSHEFRNVWDMGATVICEFVATYHFAGGQRLSLPSLTVLERRDGAIVSMRVYLDEGPLRERGAARGA